MSFGTPLLEFPELHSTNKTAAELVAAGKAGHGAVILAHAQTAGRGQQGRVWRSVAGVDLALSIITQPVGLRADAQFGLAKVAALAVHDTVRDLAGAEPSIKWPNDVLVEGRKAAGILIENELAGDKVSLSIIGIGLNVNSTSFAEELVATSLALEAGGALDRWVVLRHLLGRFGHWWGRWDEDREAGLASYTDRLWTRGRWTRMQLDGAMISARPLDVDHLGRLIVEMEDGAVQAFGSDRLRFAPR